MQIRVKTQNVTRAELAKALSGYILQEELGDEVAETLRKSHQHKREPIPERYMKVIVQKMRQEFKSLLLLLDRNVDAWFALTADVPHRTFLRKKEARHPSDVTDEQMEELRRLIEWHFKLAVGVDPRLPKSLQKKWAKAGITTPHVNMDEWISKSYVAGRLHSILENGDSYAHMLELAKQVPMSRVDQLVLAAAQQNAAKYIVGYGRKLADLAEDMLVEKHKANVHDIVQRYFSGELTQTTYNESGFTPEEAESLLSTKKRVQGWRELATELKNRFKAVDVGRDWDRIAVSETRYASNLGGLVNIQHEGGGDPDEIYVYYVVHPQACRYCKELYLHEDGTPKLFRLATILQNVQETGGMNVGRKASAIGESDGWLPNALAHPYDQCVPRRYLPAYAEFEPHEEDMR